MNLKEMDFKALVFTLISTCYIHEVRGDEQSKKDVEDLKDEILSRYADKDKQIADLQCCGNCKHGNCALFPKQMYDYCPSWQSDGMTRKEREK